MVTAAIQTAQQYPVYRVLSVLEPWASLLVYGFKTIETRSWTVAYRGPILIHASKAIKPAQIEQCKQVYFRAALTRIFGRDPKHWTTRHHAFTPGAILGAVNLVDCKEVELIRDTSSLSLNTGNFMHPPVDPVEFAFGYYGTEFFRDDLSQVVPYEAYGQWRYDQEFNKLKRVGWITNDRVVLPKAIPVAGGQSLWKFQPRTLQEAQAISGTLKDLRK